MPVKVRFGFRLEVPDTVQCQGCGRELPTEPLRLFARFWCRSCYRMMFLGARAIRFRFGPRQRRMANVATWFGVLSVGFFPLMALLQISYLSRHWLACCADGIAGAAVPLERIAYGTLDWSIAIAAGILLAIVPGWGLWRIRRTNRDRQLAGGLLAVLMAVQRLAFIELARAFAFPSRITFSWPFALCLVNGLVALAFVPIVRRIWPGV